MAYTPENNPYIPGDPYSYDLKWIVEKLKEAISLYEPLNTKFDNLYDYVHDYFDNLDLTTEVQAIINQMTTDGFFDTLVNQIVTDSGTIESTTTAWLAANVDPVGSAVVVDSSLTIAGAAADAKAVGDKLLPIKNLATPQAILSGVDLNTLLTTGAYFVTSATNAPSGFSAVLVTVQQFYNGNWSIQRVTDTAGAKPNEYMRIYANGTFSNWHEIKYANYAKSVITAATDLNTYTAEGSYIFTSVTNAPQNLTGSFSLVNIRVADNWTLQVLAQYTPNGNICWTRMNRNNGNILSPWLSMTNNLYRIVSVIGDSIYGNNRSDDAITYKLAYISGWSVYNGAIGGTRASATAGANWIDLSGERISAAIASGDFTAQTAAATALGNYYPTAVAGLAATDWTSVNKLIISYGTNDWSADVPIATYKAALETIITNICNAYPNIQLIVCGPFNRFNASPLEDGRTMTNNNGDTLYDFVTATKEVCEAYAINFVNQFDISINKLNYSYYMQPGDTTHLNTYGCDLAAENLYKNIV